MAKLYGKEWSRQELLKRVGDISQIAGAKDYILNSGNERGVHAIDVRTGSGFNFTVTPDRGMDITYAEYNGQPLCWRSATGDVHPAFYEPEGLGWLRSFYGGLVTTCGMTYAGAPCSDEGKELGLHGRISNTPAKNVCIDDEWRGDNYTIRIHGKVRESAVFGENIQLTRKIWTNLGESRFFIHDIVENLGFEPTPHMYLYHINGGFPAVDEDSLLISTSKSATPRDEEAKIGEDRYYVFERPTKGFKEKVYYHDMAVDKDGYAYSALVNKAFNNGQGFGFYVKYLKSQLPRFIEWKMNGEGTYVVGMEPANCLVEGRDKERQRGTLQFLQPGERREYIIEIGVLQSIKEIEELEAKISKIL